MNRFINIALLAIIALAIPLLLMNAYETTGTILDRINLKVVESGNLWEGLDSYPKVFPPLYPSLLWSIRQISGLSGHASNILIFCSTLVIVSFFAERYIDRKYYLIPAGLLAINNAIYYNASVISPEFLMFAEALLLMLILARYLRDPRYLYVVLLGMLTGVMCYTRYFGLIWAFPTTILCLLLARETIAKKLRHVIAYGATSFLVSMVWVSYVFLKTGYVTGMDRTAGRKEITDPAIAYIVSFVSFEDNILGTLKTLIYDLLSPHTIGKMMPVLTQKLSAYETALSIIALLLVAAPIFHLFRLVKTRAIFQGLQPRDLPAVFTVSYLVLTIGIWTMGNNDPIHTRFIFPVYPFLIMAIFAVVTSTDQLGRFQGKVRYAAMFLAVFYVGSQLAKYSDLFQAAVA